MLKWLAIVAIALAITCELLGTYATDPALRDTANRYLPFAFPGAAAISLLAAFTLVLARAGRRCDHGEMIRWLGIAMLALTIALSSEPRSVASMFKGIAPSMEAAHRVGADYPLLAKSSDVQRDLARYFLLGLGIAAVYCRNAWWTIGMLGLLIGWCIAPGALVWLALAGIAWAAASVAMSCTRCGHPLGLELTSSSFVGSYTSWNAVQKEVPFTARRSDASLGRESMEFSGTARATVHEPSEHQTYDQVRRCRRCGHQVRRRVTS
jgi:hypothetical protein